MNKKLAVLLLVMFCVSSVAFAGLRPKPVRKAAKTAVVVGTTKKVTTNKVEKAQNCTDNTVLKGGVGKDRGRKGGVR